jgi:hypothetical protein
MWSITTGTGERLIAGVSSPILGRHVDLQMPTDVREPLAECNHFIDRFGRREVAHVMEARAAKSGSRVALQLGVGNRSRHQCNAPIGAAFGGQRVGSRGQIVAVRCRVHDHAVLDAEEFMQREQFFLRRIGRREAAPWRERKTSTRPEHVYMSIASACWQLELWLSG